MKRRLVHAGAVAAALVLATGCATFRNFFSGGPRGAPSGRAGWLVYDVGGLRFEAPAGWSTSGGPDRIVLEAPDGGAKLEAHVVDERFADAKTCLAEAEEALRKSDPGLERVRRHPSTFAGVPAVAQEADSGAWHGWAWGVCDGGKQYRVFLAGRSPVAADVVEAYRTLVASARVGGEA
jgi:hypothetical protein